MKIRPFLQQGSALVGQSETIDIAFEASEAVLKTDSIELSILIPVLFTPTREDQIKKRTNTGHKLTSENNIDRFLSWEA